MSKADRPKKVKFEKFYTRAKSERLLTAGADPDTTFVDEKGKVQKRYIDHPNYHVRALAWKKAGKPLPNDASECAKFLESIHVKVKEETAS